MSQITDEYILELLSQSLIPDNTIQKAVYEKLEIWKKQSGFFKSLLTFVMNDAINIDVRFIGALILKNETTSVWAASEDKQSKKFVKDNIITCIVLAPDNIKKSLCNALQNIASFDFPKKWKNFTELINQHLMNDNISSIIGGMRCLNSLAKVFCFTINEPGCPFHELIGACHERVYAIVEQSMQGQQLDDVRGQVILLALKIFFKSIRMSLCEHVIKPVVFYGWMKIHDFILNLSVQEQPNSLLIDLTKNIWWKVKSNCLSNLSLIFSKYGKPNTPKQPNRDFCILWNATYSNPFLTKILDQQLEYHRLKQQAQLAMLQTNINASEVELMECGPLIPIKMLCRSMNILMNGCLHRCTFLPSIKDKLNPLIKEIVLYELRPSEQELELWQSALEGGAQEQREYCLCELDSDIMVDQPKYQADSILTTIANIWSRSGIASITNVISIELERIKNSQNADTNVQQSLIAWMDKDVIIYALGKTSKALINTQSIEVLEQILSNFIIPELQSNELRLRMRAMWCLGEFIAEQPKYYKNENEQQIQETQIQSQIIPQNTQKKYWSSEFTNNVVVGVIGNLTNPFLPVRIHALLSTTKLLKLESHSSSYNQQQLNNPFFPNQQINSNSNSNSNSLQVQPDRHHPLLRESCGILFRITMEQMSATGGGAEELCQAVVDVVAEFGQIVRPHTTSMFITLLGSLIECLRDAHKWDLSITGEIEQIIQLSSDHEQDAQLRSPRLRAAMLSIEEKIVRETAEHNPNLLKLLEHLKIDNGIVPTKILRICSEYKYNCTKTSAGSLSMKSDLLEDTYDSYHVLLT
ncbi:MAG: putative Ran binding protein 7 [Streblomastix strix]|uniref:Putative Ran binding protein 7 n=1 Tax=Streblomastix strix TaxID=222440 RepID=A0A5J4X8P4_9EUKA|nr:MAG: putative Ran binding protein 7 [Streblomastix strix]